MISSHLPPPFPPFHLVPIQNSMEALIVHRRMYSMIHLLKIITPLKIQHSLPLYTATSLDQTLLIIMQTVDSPSPRLPWAGCLPEAYSYIVLYYLPSSLFITISMQRFCHFEKTDADLHNHLLK
jgi:hypothetical protein